ncbi:extracellular solute-binding protein [Metabacillus litoralis]|uniref:extracellular solute-binding protein n=1 Tax=Metabacillus litoralis TaxID=152268 RepID=UPI001CFCEAC6|nr:extracellular solute-binding protein [Metabacillus litoralis]
MKKYLTIFMVFILALSVLAACGPKDVEETSSENDGNEKATEETTKPEKLVVWEDKDKSPWLKEVAQKFTEEHGIEVEITEVLMASDMREQLRLDGPAGTGPDVLTLPHDQIGELAVQGHLAELTVDQAVVDRFSESSISAQTYDGKLYGLPKSSETPVFIYNKELMDAPPATMDEVYDFSKDFTGDKKYGFLAVWDDFYMAHGVIAGNGGYVFGEENGIPNPKDLGLNNDGAVEGATYIKKWYDEGLFPKGLIGENGGSTRDGLFGEGKVASVMNGPWQFQPYKDAGIDIGIAPMPKLPNGEAMKTFMGVKGYHVSGHSKNQEWATKFVDFITTDENSLIRFEQTQEVPTNLALAEDPKITENEGAEAVAVQSQDAIPMPNIPEMGTVWEPMANNLQTIVTGKSEPKKALDTAVEQISKNIEASH